MLAMVHGGFQHKLMQISFVLYFGANAERNFLKATGSRICNSVGLRDLEWSTRYLHPLRQIRLGIVVGQKPMSRRVARSKKTEIFATKNNNFVLTIPMKKLIMDKFSYTKILSHERMVNNV
jgi:hypothetical protein